MPGRFAKSFAFTIAKLDEDKRQVFGWASVVTKNGQPVVDRQGDVITVETLEEAAYSYILDSRDASDMQVTTGAGRCIGAAGEGRGSLKGCPGGPHLGGRRKTAYVLDVRGY